MDVFIQQWVRESTTKNIASCYFCSNLGVVYSGIKPAEILCVSEEKRNQCLLLRKQVAFIVLGKKDDKYKLFVYNPTKLEETLNQKTVLPYLIQLGYSEAFTLEKYIQTLVLRLQNNESFPHEIGFFLGYPVKDVLGFMGLVDLPFIKTMGWRMYGNTKTSEQLYYQLKHAKDEILHFSKQTQSVVC